MRMASIYGFVATIALGLTASSVACAEDPEWAHSLQAYKLRPSFWKQVSKEQRELESLRAMYGPSWVSRKRPKI